MKKTFSKNKDNSKKEKVVGDVRQSQLITTFGCGSIVDFVNDTVIIAGTDKWDWSSKDPHNQFIVSNENLQNVLDKDYFVKPRTDTRRKAIFADKSKDIPAYRFPEILYCTKCHKLYHYHAFDQQNSQKIKCYCGNKTIIASRFVAVCEKGHIEDFPYAGWVHAGKQCPKSDNPQISLFNIEGRSGIESLFVKCGHCGALRGMQGAFAENALVNIMKCNANTPWLERKKIFECSEVLKTRLRTSTNVYFPATMSALSIPPWSSKIFQKLTNYYDVMIINPSMAEEVIKNIILPDLQEYSLRDVVDAFEKLKESKNGKGKKTQRDIYIDEYYALTKNESDDEKYSSQFVSAPHKYKSVIRKVVAIDRLTEVVALLGFTRMKSWSGKIDDDKIAPLSSKKQNWLPAVEMKGEGVFIEFNVERLRNWAISVKDYYSPMQQNLEQSFFTNERFSPEYVWLHTFSHLLIRQLSLECGYAAASLKEKIYSTYADGADTMLMAGVLIYTASSDSDGSLGGLVEQSDPDRLGSILDKMIDSARWCSSDPLCVSSSGQHGQGFASLNYAACHACVLLPETSCEFRNLLLDRGALIGRPDMKDLGLFNSKEFEVET